MKSVKVLSVLLVLVVMSFSAMAKVDLELKCPDKANSNSILACTFSFTDDQPLFNLQGEVTLPKTVGSTMIVSDLPKTSNPYAESKYEFISDSTGTALLIRDKHSTGISKTKNIAKLSFKTNNDWNKEEIKIKVTSIAINKKLEPLITSPIEVKSTFGTGTPDGATPGGVAPPPPKKESSPEKKLAEETKDATFAIAKNEANKENTIQKWEDKDKAKARLSTISKIANALHNFFKTLGLSK